MRPHLTRKDRNRLRWATGPAYDRGLEFSVCVLPLNNSMLMVVAFGRIVRVWFGHHACCPCDDCRIDAALSATGDRP